MRPFVVIPAVLALLTQISEAVQSVTFDEQFHYDGLSFSLALSRRVCNRAVTNVVFNRGIADYGFEISRLLSSLSANGGGSLRLGTGNFVIHSPIIMRNRTCLIGEGVDDSILTVHRDRFRSGAEVVRIFNTDKVTLANFTVKMNSSRARNGPRLGIKVHFANNTLLENITIRKAPSSSVSVFRAIGSSLTKLKLMGAGSDCLVVALSRNTAVSSSIAKECGRNGFRLLASEYTRVANGEIRNTHTGCGISTNSIGSVNTTRVQVTKMRIHNSTIAGVCAENSKTLLIENNNFTNSLWVSGDCVTIGEKVFDVLMNGNNCNNGGFKTSFDLEPMQAEEFIDPNAGITVDSSSVFDV